MHCPRCQGLMIRDHFFDYEGTSGHTWSTSQRCMNCGHVRDAVIERHRETGKKQALVVSSEPDYQDEEVHLGRESYLPAA